MKQFLLNSNPDKSGLIDLEGKDYHYLVNVRRFAVGERFSALLPNGDDALMFVDSIKDGVITCRCEKSVHSGSLHSDGRLILLQALPKADKMDLIVRQAAESGIAEIVPFVSEFSVAKTGAGGQKFSRWERLIKEARQQSGSPVATALHQPLTMSELFSYWNEIRKETSVLGLLFHHDERSALKVMSEKGLENKSLHRYLEINPKTAVLAIGPEGGFSDKEAALFIENGFQPFTIGNNILRTETAALYCAAAVKIILLERDTWELNKQGQNKQN